MKPSTTIFGAAAIGLAGAFPSAAQDIFPPHVGSFIDCAASAMESVSGLALNSSSHAINNVDVFDDSILLTSSVPAPIPLSGTIVMSAGWKWDEGALPPPFFNSEGSVQTNYAIEQAQGVPLTPNIFIVAPEMTGATADAFNGKATAAYNWEGLSSNPAYEAHVLGQSRALRDEILACVQPSVS